MFDKLIRQAVSQEIDRRLADIPKPVNPPVGYNPAEVIRGAMYKWVQVPVNDLVVWMELRTSNASQLDACGAVSLVDWFKEHKEYSRQDMIDLHNKMESICKATMNNPTFDEVASMVTKKDFVFSAARLELERLKSIDLTGLTATEKAYIDERIEEKELFLAFILPENTIDFIVRWATCGDVSDIKKVSKEKLLEAALLAKNQGGKPTDYISGVFTDRDLPDLNKAAMIVLYEFEESKKIEKNANGKKWIGRK